MVINAFPMGVPDYRHTFGELLAMKEESLYKIAPPMCSSPEVCGRNFAVL
jgi:hypothetical protein